MSLRILSTNYCGTTLKHLQLPLRLHVPKSRLRLRGTRDSREDKDNEFRARYSEMGADRLTIMIDAIVVPDVGDGGIRVIAAPNIVSDASRIATAIGIWVIGAVEKGWPRRNPMGK